MRVERMAMRLRFRAMVAMCLALLELAICGCGRTGPELGYVTGIVTLDGEPLPDAEITFHPETQGGSISIGSTNESGEYEMKFTRHREGAMLGKHLVQITTALERFEGGRMIRAKERVPVKYNQRSELTATVEPGNNSIDFKLMSDGRVVEEQD
jgi:hypothetical protein